MSSLPSLDEICSEFEELDDGAERLAYLIEVGESLPEFPAAERVEANRVQGCQSNVWLVPRATGNGATRIEFIADSDAPMVRGLVAILVAAYSGKEPRQILDYPIEKLFERLRLKTFLSPMRSNGLHSMVQRVKTLAELMRPASAEVRQPTAIHDSPAYNTAEVCDFSDAELAAIRADFPILGTKLDDGKPLVYLDNAASSQRPRQVIDSLREAYESYYSNVHRGGHALAARTTERYEAARESTRRFLNAAHRHEIIFTSGTTAAINLVARSWGDANVGRGDEIVLTEMEHHSNIVPWQQLAQRTGAVIRFAPINDDGELALDRFRALLSERTKLVAVTGVSNVLGTINPVAEIIRAAHGVGAKVLIDAAQSAPHQAIDVRTLDADFVALSGHKMLGPSGIGVLYGKEVLLDAMPPFLGGGSMIRTVTTNGFEPAMLPSKFEAGTPPIVDAIGLGAAIEYLQNVGLARIHRHEQRLARHAHELLADPARIRFLGPPPERKAGIVTLAINGLHADDLAKVLDSQGVAIRAGHHCAMPLHARLGLTGSARASFYFYNTSEEVERLATAVRLAVKMFSVS